MPHDVECRLGAPDRRRALGACQNLPCPPIKLVALARYYPWVVFFSVYTIVAFFYLPTNMGTRQYQV
jgi:hypothetical protein